MMRAPYSGNEGFMQGSETISKLMFISCTLFILLTIFTFLYNLIVYAAIISCDPAGPHLDTCNGTEGKDQMKGHSEGSLMYGLGGDDQISGGSGNDALHGDLGNDQLTGGDGDDILFGSPGADSFTCGRGNDQVVNFNESEGDTKSDDCESLWP